MKNTKYFQSMFAQAVASVALFTGHLDGGTWVAAMALALGIYAASNVAAQRVAATEAEK